ncbi:Clp protease ClpP [Candidatus Pacearchaeota archaeon]|nr:Clp protease ClpP [Candidatus Pacearchaeota archaeon]
MKTLLINGIIGWDVDERDVRNFLNENKGDDVKVEISSPGGFVSPGLGMFNLLKNHNGQVHTHLMGFAASMASYIAMAGDLISAESNAIFMIHNVSGFVGGDHQVMEKAANIFKRMSRLLAQAYANRTGKSLKEIGQLMDDETFFFGDEIKKEGFVDEIIKAKKKQKKKNVVALARMAIIDCNARMKEHAETENIEKVAAMLGDQPKAAFSIVNKEPAVEPKQPKTNTKKEKTGMDEKTLKAEHPEIYNSIFNQGVEAGKTEEKDRVTAHLTMGKQTGAIDYAMECIEGGKNMTEQSVVAEYYSKGMKKQDIEAREGDNPDNVIQDSDEDDEAKKETDLLAMVMDKSEKTGKPVEQMA